MVHQRVHQGQRAAAGDPGSHLVGEPPLDTEHGYATGMGPHPDEVKIIAPAGSLVLFNGPHLWHSGTFNDSPAAQLAPVRVLRARSSLGDLNPDAVPAAALLRGGGRRCFLAASTRAPAAA